MNSFFEDKTFMCWFASYLILLLITIIVIDNVWQVIVVGCLVLSIIYMGKYITIKALNEVEKIWLEKKQEINI